MDAFHLLSEYNYLLINIKIQLLLIAVINREAGVVCQERLAADYEGEHMKLSLVVGKRHYVVLRDGFITRITWVNDQIHYAIMAGCGHFGKDITSICIVTTWI